MAKDKVKFGVKGLHYAVLTETESGGVISYSYGTPVAIPGSVSISFDAQGEESPFYADDIKYFSTYKNNGYTGSIENAVFPESFYTDIFGDTVDSAGVRTENTSSTPKHCALMFEEEGDQNGTMFVFYDVSLSRPNRSLATTTDTVTPQTQTINFSANVRADGKLMATTGDTTTSSTKSAWYTAVYGA